MLLTVNKLLQQLDRGDAELEMPGFALARWPPCLRFTPSWPKHAEPRVLRRLWTTAGRLPAVLLGGGQVWSFDVFLAGHVAGFDQALDRKSRDAVAGAGAVGTTAAGSGADTTDGGVGNPSPRSQVFAFSPCPVKALPSPPSPLGHRF